MVHSIDFDEVMAETFVNKGGVQVLNHKMPTSFCFGKVIDSGLPVGALLLVN
jgi:glutamate-1-semialdehyde aminotransferase